MTDLATILASMRRLRAAKNATSNAPPVGDFDATLREISARADVPPVATAWSLDAKVSK